MGEERESRGGGGQKLDGRVMARAYVKVVGEHSLTGNGVVRLRFPSPGFFVVTHPDVDFRARYERSGESDVWAFLRPGVMGVYLSDGETVGYVTVLKGEE